MGVAPRPPLRLLTADLPGQSSSDSVSRSSAQRALPRHSPILDGRDERTTMSLECLLRRFAQGGMAEETFKLLLLSKVKEDERNAACDNLRAEQLRTARILAMHHHPEYAHDHQSPSSPLSTTHSASPWTKFDRNPLCLPQIVASPPQFTIAGPSSVSPRSLRHPILPPVPPPVVLPLPISLSTPISPLSSTTALRFVEKPKLKKRAGAEEEGVKEEPKRSHSEVMQAVKNRVLRNQEAARLAALDARVNPVTPELVKPAKRRKLASTSKSISPRIKSKSPVVKQESPSSVVALTVALAERLVSKPPTSLRNLLNEPSTFVNAGGGYATSDIRSS